MKLKKSLSFFKSQELTKKDNLQGGNDGPIDKPRPPRGIKLPPGNVEH